MHDIAASKGDFTLFALFRRPDAFGMWDLVVSAPWLEARNLAALDDFVSLLRKSIGRNQLSQLARVETLPSDDERVRHILDSVPIEDAERRIVSTDLFELEIEEAIILRAQRPDQKKPARKALAPAVAGSARRRP